MSASRWWVGLDHETYLIGCILRTRGIEDLDETFGSWAAAQIPHLPSTTATASLRALRAAYVARQWELREQNVWVSAARREYWRAKALAA
jgi:hypothetical protein